MAAGRIHYLIGGMVRPRGEVSGSDAAQQILHWVEDNLVVPTVSGTAVYVLSQ